MQISPTREIRWSRRGATQIIVLVGKGRLPTFLRLEHPHYSFCLGLHQLEIGAEMVGFGLTFSKRKHAFEVHINALGFLVVKWKSLLVSALSISFKIAISLCSTKMLKLLCG